jgi:hypothetical protein
VARPLRIQYAGAFYHVTSRGNDRKAIFRNDRDREKFVSYLQSAYGGRNRQSAKLPGGLDRRSWGAIIEKIIETDSNKVRFVEC